MVMHANRVSHNKYARVCFQWMEAYAPTTDQHETVGTITRWILNRPGPNVSAVLNDGVSPKADELVERNAFGGNANFGSAHQPYLWDQISADYDEYRVYGCKYKLTLSHIGGKAIKDSTAQAVDEPISICVGVTQLIYDNSGPLNINMETDHLTNVPVYREGKDRTWKFFTLYPGQTKTVTGYVNFKKFLKPGNYNNENEQLNQYPWFSVASTLTETDPIGDENQNQPYYGWTAKVSNIKETHGGIDWDDATYGRAPQCAFLTLMHCEQSNAVGNDLQLALTCKQYVEFKRADPVYAQS